MIRLSLVGAAIAACVVAAQPAAAQWHHDRDGGGRGGGQPRAAAPAPQQAPRSFAAPAQPHFSAPAPQQRFVAPQVSAPRFQPAPQQVFRPEVRQQTFRPEVRTPVYAPRQEFRQPRQEFRPRFAEPRVFHHRRGPTTVYQPYPVYEQYPVYEPETVYIDTPVYSYHRTLRPRCVIKNRWVHTSRGLRRVRQKVCYRYRHVPRHHHFYR